MISRSLLSVPYLHLTLICTYISQSFHVDNLKMQVILLLLSTLSFLNLYLSKTQSGAGPHIGSVVGRLKHVSNTKRHHGIVHLISNQITRSSKRAGLSVAEEAAGLQSAVYAIIVSISSGLGNAEALIGGVKNVEFNRLVFSSTYFDFRIF